VKVCLVTGEYPPMRGGVADYTAFLAAALARYDVATTVVTSSKALAGRTRSDRAASTAEVIPVADWGYGSWRRVIEVVEGTRSDVVHVQYQTAAFGMHPAINLLPVRLRLVPARPRVAVTFHDLRVPYLFPKAGPVRQLANVLLVAGADAVVTTNAEDAARLAPGRKRSAVPDGTRDRVGRFGPPLYRIPIGSNIPVSPSSGYDRVQWRARLGVGPDQLLLSYFGFLAPSKGVDLLLAALGELVRRGRNVRLLMIGGSAGDTSVSADRAYERQIRARTDEPTYRGRVLWTGFTGPEEVSANLLASDVCVLPFREGASCRHGTLVAAIVHGLPIVTTAPPALSPLRDGIELRSGENCYLVPPEDVGRLVDAVEEVAASEALRIHLAEGARALGEHFRWDTIARQTIRMYQEMLE